MTQPPHEPLSWLTLERYVLGELSVEELARVEEQLERSPKDRACLESILADDAPLPPLPAFAPRARRRRTRAWPASMGLLAAAAALLLWLVPWRHQGEIPPSMRWLEGDTKGGEIALSLLGERQGAQASHFEQGERFRLQVTCPTWFRAPLRVLVFQGGRRYEPLPEATLTCGNLVPWPGAFSLDGSGAVDVCVTWSPPPSHATSARALEDAVCTRLLPR